MKRCAQCGKAKIRKHDGPGRPRQFCDGCQSERKLADRRNWYAREKAKAEKRSRQARRAAVIGATNRAFAREFGRAKAA